MQPFGERMGVNRRVAEPSDPGGLPRLLRLGGDRRSERTGQGGQQEAAAVHYSIT
jgi:hypothetical protein